MKLVHKFREGLYAFINLYILKKETVVVYAPGRVGSMGLLKNLRDAGIFSFKVESFQNETRGATLFCRDHIINKKKTVKIITLVRDPMDIMCSYFYSKAVKGWISEATEALSCEDIPKLQEIFIEKCLRTERLDHHLYWYEDDFAPSLGFSIFENTFNKSTGWSKFKYNQYSVLVMRTELNDKIKSDVLTNFLGKPSIKITRENVRALRKDSIGYSNFKETLSIPNDILKKIYSAPYVTCFFSAEDISKLKTKWS